MATDLTIVIKGRNDASGAIQSVNSDLRSLGTTAEQSSGKTTGLFGGIAQAAGGILAANVIGGITEQIGGLVSGMVNGNAAFETYNTQFGVMLGSADLAKQRIADLAQFGASTPFELPQVVEADKVLQGFGLHSQEAAQQFGFSGEQIRTIAGDVASGTGVDFAEMALNIGKFSKGATGEAIARFMELGILTRDELAKLGVQFSKSGELMSPLPEATNAMLSIMQEKYGGMMAAQSATFEGMKSNLADWVGSAQRTLGAPVFDVLKNALGDLLGVLSANAPQINAALTSVGTVIAGVLSGAISFLSGTVIPGLVAAWNMIQPAVQTAWTALQAIGILFGDLASAAQGWGANIVQQLANGIMAAASAVINSLSYIGDIITEWLIPHSPPKLLPNIDTWGTATANVWLDGWTKADFSIFDSLGSTIESTLKGLVDVGSLPKDGLVPALIGAKGLVADALSQFEQTGTVGEATFAALRESLGAAGAEVEQLTRLMLDQASAQQAVTDAQRELDTITGQYDDKIGGLQAKLKALSNDEQRAADAKKKAYLQEIANSDLSDADTKAKARRELEKLSLQEQIRAAQDEKAVAVDAAKDKLDAAKQHADQVAIEVELQQKRIKAQNDYNALLARQAQLLEQVKGGGGGGSQGLDQAAKDAERAAKAQRDYAFSVADTEGKLAMLYGELGKVKEGSEEYWRIKGQITQLEGQHQRELDASSKAQQDATKAQRDFEYATADTAGKISILKNELANSKEGSEEYWRIKTQLASVEQQYQRELDAAAKKTDAAGSAMAKAGGGASGLGASIGGLSSGLGSLAPKLDDLPTKTNPVNQAFVDMKDKMLDAAEGATTGLSPAMQLAGQMMDGWRVALDLFMPLIGLVSPLVASAGEVVQGFVAQVVAGFNEGGILGAVQVLLDGLAEISPTFALIQAVVDAALPPLIDIVQSIFGIIAGFIQENGSSIVGFIQSTWTSVQDIIRSVIPPIQSIVSTVFGAIRDFLQTHGAEIQSVLTQAWQTIQVVINGVLDVIKTIIVPALSVIAGFITSHADQIKGILDGAWNVIKGIVEGALGIIRGVIQTVTSVIHGDWSGAWDGIKTIFSSVWEGIKTVLSGALEIIRSVLQVAWDAVKGIFQTSWDGIKTVFNTAWDGIKQKVSDVIDPIKTKVESVWNGIKTSTETIWNGIRDAIGAAIGGVMNLIKGPINAIIGAVNTLIDGINAVSSAVGGDTIPSIPYLAKGTNFWGGGLAFAGEAGPEAYRTPSGDVGVLTGGLYRLPRGSQVLPAQQTAHALRSSSVPATTAAGTTTIYNQTMNIYSNATTEDVASQFDWMTQARS